MNRGPNGRRGPLVAFALAGIVAASAASAQDLNGYLRSRGHGDVALSYNAESYDMFWRGTTKVSNSGLGQVDTDTVSAWLAFGLTDRVTLFANLPYVDASSDGTMGWKDSGLADFSAIAAGRIWGGGDTVKHSIVGGVGFRSIASNYVADAPVSVGDGTADWLVRLVYQLRWRHLYFSQQVGFDRRGGDAPNGTPFYTEIGNTWGDFTLNAFVNKLVAGGGTDINPGVTTFPSNKEEYTRGGLKGFYRVNERFGVALAFYTTFDGRNTGDSTGYSLGVDFGF